MANLAERARAIATKARNVTPGKRAIEPPTARDDEPQGSGFPLRSWWTVYRWGGEKADVFVHPPMSQHDVRATFFPDAAGVLPHGI